MDDRQDLLDDAETCRRKMLAASTLIGGLGGEKERWTEQSKEFEAQIGRYHANSIVSVRESVNCFRVMACSRSLLQVLSCKVYGSCFPKTAESFCKWQCEEWIKIAWLEKYP